MAYRRVVVTGIGAVSPIGITCDLFWNSLVSGVNGVGPITLFNTDGYPVKLGAEVKNFNPTDFMPIKRADRAGRCTQFAIAAAQEAIKQARLDMTQERPERVGVIIGTSGMVADLYYHSEVLRQRGPKRIDPLMIHKIGANMVPVQLAMALGARGPNSSVNSACATGSDAIGIALSHLRLGHAEVMVAGGAESTINPVAVASTGLVGALSRQTDPAKASRPFDLERDGFVYGEGAGILILETYEHAVERGAPLLAEVAGAGWSYDASNETAPDAEGEAIAIKAAIGDAAISPEEIDYINAHGTGTQLNDKTETEAIKLALGRHAYHVPVSSNKSMIGHLACAAGAIEAVASVLTLLHGVAPPTINYRTPDPECDLDYVPNTARKVKVETVLSNSFGMGGQNCCLILKKVGGSS
jgi:3-oxoacyl-[acyl-carrier-protein] synthase II